MNHLRIIILAVLSSITLNSIVLSQGDDSKNIISYYAVGNSLDGQPLIDSKNALRFFPVFIFREKTKSVRISAYIGSKIFNTEAIQSSDYSFWQANLPEFKFGEAIQRLEVETKIELDQSKIKEFEKLKSELDNSFKADSAKLDTIRNEILNSLVEISKQLDKIVKSDLNITVSDYNEKLKANVSNALKLDSNFNSLIAKLNEQNIDNIQDALRILKSNQEKITNDFNLYKGEISNISKENNQISQDLTFLKNNLETLTNRTLSESFNDMVDNLVENKLKLESMKDTLKKQFVRDMYQNFVDTNIIGPQVKESDIIIEDGYARILYRNYKPGLRQLPALDPAEKLGVFRIRYVPFPVVGDNLYRPFTDNSIGVFEIGLGFSDVTITGDDFVKPTLSAERLGIAFAVTQKLFKSDAEILALVLTYDFNAYGSIGIGADFAYPEDNKKVEPYYSFGINKKAFEDLVIALGKFFNGL